MHVLLHWHYFSKIDMANSTETSRTLFIRISKLSHELGNSSNSNLCELKFSAIEIYKDLLPEICQVTDSSLRAQQVPAFR